MLFVLGRANTVLDVSLEKYAWQFGASDFAGAMARVQTEARVVQPATITRRSHMALLGGGEAAELQRQTDELAAALQRAALRRNGGEVTVRRFPREEGDAHCQIANLRLARLVVFGWLDRVFENAVAPRQG